MQTGRVLRTNPVRPPPPYDGHKTCLFCNLLHLVLDFRFLQHILHHSPPFPHGSRKSFAFWVWSVFLSKWHPLSFQRDPACVARSSVGCPCHRPTFPPVPRRGGGPALPLGALRGPGALHGRAEPRGARLRATGGKRPGRGLRAEPSGGTFGLQLKDTRIQEVHFAKGC